MGMLDKYDHVESAKGTANMGNGPEKISSSVKSGSDHTVHETKNSVSGKGHTTFHNDGNVHQHGTHSDKGYGSSWLGGKK